MWRRRQTNAVFQWEVREFRGCLSWRIWPVVPHLSHSLQRGHCLKQMLVRFPLGVHVFHMVSIGNKAAWKYFCLASYRYRVDVDVDSNAVSIGDWAKKLSCSAVSLSRFPFLATPCFSGSPQPSPKILSALYAYDGCMGGVNDFSTEEEYMQEIKRFVGSTLQKIMKKANTSRRNCTVVLGPAGKEVCQCNLYI